MTRLQNAKKQLSEALEALESAASHTINGSAEAGASASRDQRSGQTPADADLSALIEEVSIIEATLSQAVTMIASIEPSTVSSVTIDDGDTQ